ncbi:MAG: MFS transporter, partial [Desulfobacterales bacterium]
MHRPWLIFSVSCSLFFLSQFYRVSNAVIAPEILRDLSLDTRGLGLISASFFYAFALTQIPISLLLDKIGPRRMMTALSAMGIFGAIIFSWANSMALGVTGRILMGVGMACNLMGTYKLLTLWFSPRTFATLAGLVVALGTAGNMVATAPLVILVDQIGWRSSFQLIAVINLILAFLFFVIVRDRPHQNNSEFPAANINIQHAFANLRLLITKKDF